MFLQVASLPEFQELRERFLHDLFYKNDDPVLTATEVRKMRHYPSSTNNFVQKVGHFVLVIIFATFSKSILI